MSIKSEKARKFIQNKLTDACDPRFVGHRYTMMLGRNNAFRAVRIAESDARERAVRAFIETTSKHTFYTEGHIRTLPEFREFLKHYDQ